MDRRGRRNLSEVKIFNVVSAVFGADSGCHRRVNISGDCRKWSRLLLLLLLLLLEIMI